MLDNSNDVQIWTGLRSGDKDALLALYRRFYVDLKNFALRLTGDPELSSDCITQCLLYLWDKRRELPVVHNLRAYLLTCLRHQVYAAIRAENRSRRESSLIQHFYRDEASYEDQLIERQTGVFARQKLASALDGLAAREKEMLRLRFFEDLDYEEIARRCGITKRTAYNTIHSALKRLRLTLSPDSGAAALPRSLLPSLVLALCGLAGAAPAIFSRFSDFIR